jgi:alkylated DNA repair dioxygenase AlkB
MIIHILTKNSVLNEYEFKNTELIDAAVSEVLGGDTLEQKKTFCFGKWHTQRRWSAFYSRCSSGYKFSGSNTGVHPLGEYMQILLSKVNLIFKAEFNSILVNYYIDGNNKIDAHSDNETSVDMERGVVAISWGAVRKFRIRNKDKSIFKDTGKKFKDIPTVPYKILHMAGDFQDEFTHEIPVEKKIKEPRMSFTFRKHTK